MGSSPILPTTFEIEEISPPEMGEAKDEPAYGTDREARLYCTICGETSDLTFRGIGYCDFHYEAEFCDPRDDGRHVCDCPACAGPVRESGKDSGVEYEEIEIEF